MTYKELGFRYFDHKFVAIRLTDKLRPLVKGFSGEEKATGLLLYGYIDHDNGFSFEVLAAGEIQGDNNIVSPIGEDNDVRAVIRVKDILDDELIFLNVDQEMAEAMNADKLSVLKEYELNDEINETRDMDFLDQYRHGIFIDDIYVALDKEGYDVEGCYVRIEGLSEHEIKGILINEPKQDLGCHGGDEISFGIQMTEDGNPIPVAFIDG